MELEIKNVRGHFEIYDGIKFVGAEDTYPEAIAAKNDYIHECEEKRS